MDPILQFQEGPGYNKQISLHQKHLQFGYNEHLLTTSSFFCIFLLVVLCICIFSIWWFHLMQNKTKEIAAKDWGMMLLGFFTLNENKHRRRECKDFLHSLLSPNYNPMNERTYLEGLSNLTLVGGGDSFLPCPSEGSPSHVLRTWWSEKWASKLLVMQNCRRRYHCRYVWNNLYGCCRELCVHNALT